MARGGRQKFLRTTERSPTVGDDDEKDQEEREREREGEVPKNREMEGDCQAHTYTQNELGNIHSG